MNAPLVTLRLATHQDSALLLGWANDPLSRSQSFSSAAISAAEHESWMKRVIDSPDHLVLVAQLDTVPCGVVRLDREQGAGKVSISVAPEMRGKGVGKALLQAALASERFRAFAPRLVAHVKQSNAASQHLFAAAGFARAALASAPEGSTAFTCEFPLAIIPARGGSKRIPRKNVKPLLGRPVVEYAIAAARQANCFGQVMVSTDDTEIADVARAAGATVPFPRSDHSANDTATLAQVVREVLEEYNRRGVSWDAVCCILPTAVLLSPRRLCEGLAQLESSGAPSVVPVVRFGYPVQRALRVADGVLSWVEPKHALTRSQDLEPLYHDAGQFYWIRVAPFLAHGAIVAPGSAALELPESEVQDIDTEEDWKLAEMKLRARG